MPNTLIHAHHKDWASMEREGIYGGRPPSDPALPTPLLPGRPHPPGVPA